MNTRQGILVTSFAATLFMNFASIYWTMWSVLSMSMFVLVVTDFMFFEVRGARSRVQPLPSSQACAARGAPWRARSRALLPASHSIPRCPSLTTPLA